MVQKKPEVGGIIDALSDPTRRAVVELLVREPHRAGDLASATGVSRSQMSKHLRVLLEAGVAFDERPSGDARARVFHLRPEALDPVRGWLESLQTEWDRRLGSFKRHVEKGRKDV